MKYIKCPKCGKTCEYSTHITEPLQDHYRCLNPHCDFHEDIIRKKKNKKQDIKEYDNKLKIIVNDFKCDYAGCGSHQMELEITIDKENLIKFLEHFQEEK